MSKIEKNCLLKGAFKKMQCEFKQQHTFSSEDRLNGKKNQKINSLASV